MDGSPYSASTNVLRKDSFHSRAPHQSNGELLTLYSLTSFLHNAVDKTVPRHFRPQYQALL